MKLLLDELYPAAIAQTLRKQAHDVTAVQEEPGLPGLDDATLFAEAQRRGRALVTENVADFTPLAVELAAQGGAHFGLVFTSNRRFPRHRAGFIGALARALDDLLARHPGDGPDSRILWL